MIYRCLLAVTAIVFAPQFALAGDAKRPNIVIVVADDMGWGDTGYSGNKIVKTPHLDSLVKTGVRFDNFYSAQQMCSPGRFAILTGRNPFRTGLARLGAMRPQEVTIAELLNKLGYATAHFGKWHLGGNPIREGFDVSYFSPDHFNIGGTFVVYDNNKKPERIKIEGDSSVFTMNLALEFIRKQAALKKPFFAYVCFGSPHAPHVGAEEFLKLYADQGKYAHFLAEISGIDAAVGNLRAELRRLGIADNTIIWFTSDNGGITPLSMDPSGKGKLHIGVRTVACLEWPGRFQEPIRCTFPCFHQDMLPTLLEAVGSSDMAPYPLDGISLFPALEGKMKKRPTPMGFLAPKPTVKDLAQSDFIKDTWAVWIDWPFKLMVNPPGVYTKKGQGELVLYHLEDDPAERTNVADRYPEQVAKMRRDLEAWQRSVRDSFDGKDYKK
ncbi:sulfatase family protein [Thermogemmata fonticola]|uniref:Sulfatase-like hydrolase/transferase n=1 Tax=Thermogemmata fonticola TaxID=2755323 RepID=A0A7V8VBE1_9BACT|nr:sulfatase-like hydrolase/transferase [Thermogemmata fonticola]MBA2224927.1 sulfatase-like hydrolase/transferase [Thermogemmata fonticola]